ALPYDTAYSRTEKGWTRSTCTPGETNENMTVLPAQTLKEPTFSAPGGFYDEAFSLTLTAGGGERIYYTLDGSVPTEDSLLYTGPITVEDPSEKENVYAKIREVTTDFAYAVPTKLVDKALVVRAITQDVVTGAVSAPATETYFIGYGNRKDYENTPVVSLVTDPDNLFGLEKGIYVLGKGYEEYKKNGGFDNLPENEVPQYYVDENGNSINRYESFAFWQRGREAERPGTITLFDEKHLLSFQQDIGIRIAGGGSRFLRQKSFNVYARKVYDNQNSDFKKNPFGIHPISKLRLKNTDDDIIFRDHFLRDCVKERNLEVADGTGVALFLDGEYWGLYYMMELYDKEYFFNNFGINESDLRLVEDMEVKYGGEETLTEWSSYIDQIAYMDMADPIQYAFVERVIDLDNLIDFYCIALYCANEDFRLTHNCMTWREEGENGKWRFLLYDLDTTAREAESNTFEFFHSLNDKSYLPGYLYANSDFKEKFCVSMMDIANTCFSYEKVHLQLSKWADKYENQSILRKRRFEDENATASYYREAIEKMDTFFRDRRPFIERYMKEDMALAGEAVTSRIENDDPEGGEITINTAKLPATETWEGRYFSDYPVTLTAVPKEGYRFMGWTGDVQSEEAQIKTDVQEGLHIRAVFEKE
ncbi:MAG: CotH kinase family protein, partial [Lachnospiraceae bacterium]|nr:CotH kinase family protein [Lachnospiraceae bacterium]